MGAQSLLCQRVKLASLDIGFELPIPGLSVEVDEPLAEPNQLFRHEFLHPALQISNPAHTAPPSMEDQDTPAARLLKPCGRPPKRPRVAAIVHLARTPVSSDTRLPDPLCSSPVVSFSLSLGCITIGSRGRPDFQAWRLPKQEETKNELAG